MQVNMDRGLRHRLAGDDAPIKDSPLR